MDSRDGEFSGGRDAAAIDSDDDRPAQPFPDRNSFSHHTHHFPRTETDDFQRRFAATENEETEVVRDDAWSCIIVVITFWVFVSMTLIFGVYGSETLRLGVNSSILIKPHPLFVEYVKVEQIGVMNNGLMLYGFYGTPSLDVVTNWSEQHKATLPGNTHKEWMYFLNMGSQIEIVYNVTSMRSSSIVLVIAQGTESLAQWLEDPYYPNSTFSWDLIHGTGVIGRGISKSSSYYVAVGNLNSDVVEVELHIRVRALLYNATNAYHKCTLAHGPCSMKILILGGNSALLSSPGLELGAGSKWNVKLSYGPRWITYIGGIGGMTILMLLLVRFSNNFRHPHHDESSENRAQGNMGSENAPLLSRKEDLSSLGSSYDSVSEDDEDPANGPTVGSSEGNPMSDQEYNNNTQRLCAICFDAPRDCFFLPCGHCVACYACGTRIAEAAGTCPICRRHMKKVRRIYTV